MKVYVLDEHLQVTINSSPIMFLSGLDREALKLYKQFYILQKKQG